MKTLTKSIPVNFKGVSSGDGYWGMKEGVNVIFNKCDIILTISQKDNIFWAELRLTHDADAEVKGLCYSDFGIQVSVSRALAEYQEIASVVDVSLGELTGSEQGMQGRFMFSMYAEIIPGIKQTELVESGFLIT